MEQDTLRVHPSLRDPDRERVLDWLTALVPMLILSVLYFHGQALALLVTAVGGYLMAAMLFGWATKIPWTEVPLAPALLGGFLAAFCLPASAPWWLSALFGGAVAAMNTADTVLSRVYPAHWIARPLFSSVLVAYLALRLLFPIHFTNYTTPAQFSSLDGATQATPLAALEGGEAADLWQLLFGAHAGALGEIAAAAVLLGALFLILRRRVRLIAPACLLATVALLSWVLWGSVEHALYAVLAGGLLFATLLFADSKTAPFAPRDQIIVGVIAGIITVCIRRFGGWAEGVAVGVIAAQLVLPILPFVYRFCHVAWIAISRWSRVAWMWAKPYVVRLFRLLGAAIVVGARWLWRAICRGLTALISQIKNQIRKSQK